MEILEKLVTNIELEHLIEWLTSDITHKDLEEIVKSEATTFKDIFPFLLLDFLKIQTSRILKWNNVAPTELSSATPSPKREPLVVHSDLFSTTPSPKNIKNVTSPVEIRNVRRITPQQQQQHRTIDLQSETAFPSLQSAVNKETPKKRRINPTQLLSDAQSTPTKSPVQFGSCVKFNPPSPAAAGNPFNQAREQINGQKNLDQERALLKERKQTVKSPCVASVVLDLSANISKSWSCHEPELDFVTHKVLLNRLAAILSFCLSNHLIPSIYSEIKFLIELLVIRVSPARYTPSTCDGAGTLLNNVHNCVYFAAKCLEQLFDSVWSHIDRCLLQQLMSNPRLMQFSPDFISKLSRLASSSLGEGSRRPPAHRTVANVPFQTDTDNRLNFASDSSFQYFRKQRDQFCEVWQIWKSNHANPGWNMTMALQRMIQSLVNLKQDVVNYVHLARLFRSQLLNVAQLVEVVQDDDGPLSQLQSSDPDKLRRLRERLTESRARPSSSPGAVHFEGDQAFFRDFIQLAANPAFNEHLKNCLVSGIEQGSRAEDCDEADRFAETVIVLKVQAKFIAFLTFHPHMSSDHLPEHVFHQLSRLRSAQQPPIDLFFYTDNAFRLGRLVLTIPWIVTYLSLADPVSLSLPYCHSVLCYVVYIFRRADRFGSPSNAFFVRILLSWLLEQVNLPRSLLTKTDADLMKEIQKKRTELYSIHPVADGSSTSTGGRLDELIVVESSLIYQCCPFVWTWKHLLTNFACSDARSSSDGRSLTSRKITPVSAEENKAVTGKGFPGVKSLQLSLEESFFHNQPSSVKRTVDFVAERVASNIVRDIRHQIIPRVSLDAAGDDGCPRANDDSFCQRLCESVRLQAAERVSSATASLDATLSALLPNDLLPAVKQVCCAVAARLTNDKVTEWLQLHVTISFFRNEADKVDKASAKRSAAAADSLTLSNPATVHDASTWSPSFLIDHLKKQVREIIEDDEGLTSADLNDLLNRCDGTLHRRLDLTPVVFKCLQQLTLDLIFVLCVFQPEKIVSDDIRSWVEFWKRTFSIETVAVSESSSSSLWIVFAPRQLLMLAQSTSARLSWSHVSTLVVQLLKSGLLRYKDVQEQCLSVVRQDWPQELLGRFATCIRDVVDWQQGEQTRGNGGGSGDDPRDHSDDNDGLLSWLSWFCSQDDLL